MAPISEKRSQQQPHLKDNNNHSHSHAKENASTRHSKRGLEILDFHESWLEEMELYKDKLFVQKHKHQHLLGSHNHVHTPQGCQIEPHIVNNITNNNNNNIKTVKNSANNNETTTKQRGAEQTVNKARITIRNTPISTADATATTAASPPISIKQNSNVQVRPRDDASLSKTNTGHSKRQSHAKSQANASTKNSNAIANPSSGVSSVNIAPKPAKIIVNQFHASSLLSSQQLEDKAKILTLNGLTKSAATAFETSLYAANYLPQDNKTGLSFNGAKPLNGEQSNYIGVSLAKCGDGDRLKDLHGGAGDDPCAAIDDVNEYTDSDTDEEYTGQPFFLMEDSTVTYQSRNIRHPQERIPSEESESDQPEYYQPTSILSPSIFPNVPPYLNFSSHAVKGPSMPQALHKVLKWKLSPVMPKIVKRVVLNSGFRIIKSIVLTSFDVANFDKNLFNADTTDWMAIWEKHMKSPGFRTIRSHQKYNHMPGSFRIGRKDSMWKSLHSNMKKFGNKEFGFMQKSYVMPEDLESLRQVWPKNASKLTKWIVKPPASARGTGIRIVNKWSQFPKDRPLVVQKYIERPLLINENKFDLRIYVVVTSVNPLRIYMYKDGLARFASVKYSSELNSLDDRCMHLTNYSINKFSQNYSKNEDFNACQGHKWTLQSLWSCLEGRGVNTNHLWATLRNLVIKAIISGESGLNRTYRQNVNFRYNCFELFGFDVLLDENIIPWLLEINISPSLHSELPLDLHVKGPLIQAVLNTALYQVPPKLNEKQQKEILEELDLQGPLCHDKRIFTTCLTAEEVRKHNQFTNRSIELREEYVDSILDTLLPDDVRCLIIAEDERSRCTPLERVFPTPDTHIYLRFIDNPRYYNRLLDAWEHKYGHNRAKGINLITELCKDGYHLEVSDAALEKEPNVALTEIDMLHAKKSEDQLNVVQVGDSVSVSGSGHASKAGSPDSTVDSMSTIVTVSSGWKEPTEQYKKRPKDETTYV